MIIIKLFLYWNCNSVNLWLLLQDERNTEHNRLKLRYSLRGRIFADRLTDLRLYHSLLKFMACAVWVVTPRRRFMRTTTKTIKNLLQYPDIIIQQTQKYSNNTIKTNHNLVFVQLASLTSLCDYEDVIVISTHLYTFSSATIYYI